MLLADEESIDAVVTHLQERPRNSRIEADFDSSDQIQPE